MCLFIFEARRAAWDASRVCLQRHCVQGPGLTPPPHPARRPRRPRGRLGARQPGGHLCQRLCQRRLWPGQAGDGQQRGRKGGWAAGAAGEAQGEGQGGRQARQRTRVAGTRPWACVPSRAHPTSNIPALCNPAPHTPGALDLQEQGPRQAERHCVAGHSAAVGRGGRLPQVRRWRGRGGGSGALPACHPPRRAPRTACVPPRPAPTLLPHPLPHPPARRPSALQIDRFLYSTDAQVVAGALLAVGIVNCGVQDEVDPALALLAGQCSSSGRARGGAAAAGGRRGGRRGAARPAPLATQPQRCVGSHPPRPRSHALGPIPSHPSPLPPHPPIHPPHPPNPPTPPPDYVDKEEPAARIGAVLGLGLAYAGRRRRRWRSCCCLWSWIQTCRWRCGWGVCVCACGVSVRVLRCGCALGAGAVRTAAGNGGLGRAHHAGPAAPRRHAPCRPRGAPSRRRCRA